MTPPTSSPSLSPEHLAAIDRLRLRFGQLPDPRMSGRILHRLDEVLMIAFCSILADNDAFTDMEVFAKTQLPWLRTFLTLKHGAPSHDVFRNVLIALRPQALLDLLAHWSGDLTGQTILIDGKSLRGSASPSAGQPMIHLLRAWVHAAGLSAAHAPCAEKSNELTTLPSLLDSLQLQGAIVSIDAMGCHPEIAEQLQLAGADYLLALKANQKTALHNVQAHFQALDLPSEQDAGLGVTALAGHASLETIELSHGRYEQRRYQATEELRWFDKSWKWVGLRSVIRVQRNSHRGSAREALSQQTVYYLSSLPANAPALAQLIRQHWAVENTCHWTLDMTFGEDHCQVRERTAAHNLCLLRELTGRALREHPAKKSLRAKRKQAALDPAFRLEILAHALHSFHA